MQAERSENIWRYAIKIEIEWQFMRCLIVLHAALGNVTKVTDLWIGATQNRAYI